MKTKLVTPTWDDVKEAAKYIYLNNGGEIHKLITVATLLLKNNEVDTICPQRLVFGMEAKLFAHKYNAIVKNLWKFIATLIALLLFIVLFFTYRSALPIFVNLPLSALLGFAIYHSLIDNLLEGPLLHHFEGYITLAQREKNMKVEDELTLKLSMAPEFLDLLGSYNEGEDIIEIMKDRLGEIAFQIGKDDRLRPQLKRIISLIIFLDLIEKMPDEIDSALSFRLYAHAFVHSTKFIEDDKGSANPATSIV